MVQTLVFLFSGHAALAGQPERLVPGHGLYAVICAAICHAMAIGNADTGCGELAIQPALLPRSLIPRRRLSVRHVPASSICSAQTATLSGR